MKIAQIAPLAESCPPRLYGGTERVVAWLCNELAAQGHDVTLFASGDFRTAATLVRCSDLALRLNPAVREHLPYHMIMLDEIRRRACEFDVLHFHIDLLHYPLIRPFADRTVTTLHGRLDLPDLRPFYSAFPEIPVVSISHRQRAPMPAEVNWVGNVYHGIPADQFPFVEKKGEYSGVHRPNIAREAARPCHRGCAGCRPAAEDCGESGQGGSAGTWEEAIAPLVAANPSIEYVGEVNEAEKAALLGNARALLFPIDWPEPFGLVMIEAMACGTPVIATPCGAVPEVVDQGITGYIVADVEEAISAVHRIREIDRSGVRARFEQRFTARRMTKDYLDVYAALPGVSQSEAELAEPKDVNRPLTAVA